MSKILAGLLDQSEEAVAKAINELETLNGFPSHDARLLAESSQSLKQKLKQLQLDPEDTTAEELYYCLLSKYENDSRRLDSAINVSHDSNLEIRAAKAAELVGHIIDLPESWAIKRSKLRQILSSHTPSKTMKRLHYRSINSLIRREDLTAIFMAAIYIESDDWRKAVVKEIAASSSVDFEMRQAKVVVIPQSLTAVKGPARGVISNQAVAAAAIWPSEKLGGASCLSITLLLLMGLEDLGCRYSMQSVAKLNPLLNWWSNSEHLISRHQNQPISLNLLDAAVNHLENRVFGKHLRQAAQAGLLRHLHSLYDHQPSALSELVARDSLDNEKYKFELPVAKLAPEYVEI